MTDDDSLANAIGVSLVLIVLAGQFDNHLWRLIVIGVSYALSSMISIPSVPWWASFLVVAAVIMHVPHLRSRQKRQGSIFVTGADSGMGQATVVYLAKTNKNKNTGSYKVIFAGAYDAGTARKTLEELCTKEGADFSLIQVVPLNVTSDTSVAEAAAMVKKSAGASLTSLVCYHGVAFNGPIEYMPIAMYQRQHDVNYVGNIRMVQNFLPLIKEGCKGGSTRGRIVLTGTGGGPCSPCPPLLSAYMSSKFACEAFTQSLRSEMIMTNTPIDCCVINPGFVKPTMLMEEGKKLSDKMWKACEDKMGSTKAKDEFGPLLDHFMKYSALTPGTHVSEVCKAAENALTAYRPRSSYKVGIDSKLAPIVGMLPTGVREKIATHGMYGILSPAGTVKGYVV